MAILPLGIDISKKDLKAALRVGGKVKFKTCANREAGFKELAAWLGKQDAGKAMPALSTPDGMARNWRNSCTVRATPSAW